MRKIFVVCSVVAILFMTNHAMAQTTRLFGISSDSIKFYIQERGLYNAIYPETNKFTGVANTFKDGSPLTEDIFFGDTPTVSLDLSDPLIEGQLKAHVLVMFTSEQKEILKGEPIYLNLKFDPETGKISDYELEFPYNSKINSNLPNLQLVRYLGRMLTLIKGTITDVGKKMNFCEMGMKIIIQP